MMNETKTGLSGWDLVFPLIIVAAIASLALLPLGCGGIETSPDTEILRNISELLQKDLNINNITCEPETNINLTDCTTVKMVMLDFCGYNIVNITSTNGSITEVNTTCPEKIKYINVTNTCPKCPVTQEQYTKLAVQLKRSEAIIGKINNSDYVTDLEINLSRYKNRWESCNDTMVKVRQFINEV